MKLSILLLLTVIPSMSYAQGPVVSLAEQMRPYVRTLSHSIFTFNYVPRSRTAVSTDSTLNLADPSVLDHLKNTLESYWDPQYVANNDTDAQGLYVSDDPFSSRDFGGGSDWLMFRIELPAGHRYLDIRALNKDEKNDTISDEMRAALAKQGCPGQDYYKYLFRKGQNPSCRSVAYQTLKDLHVDSFFYDWSWVYFSHCAKESKAAMVLLNSALLTPQSVQGFSSRVGSPDLLAADRAMLESLRLDIGHDSGDDSTLGKTINKDHDQIPFWSASPPQPVVDIGTWEQWHLLGCNGKDQTP